MIYEPAPLQERIFRFLQANALVRNAADFSRLMGRSRTYHAVMRQLHRQPSPECWCHLADHLRAVLNSPVQEPTRAAIHGFLGEIIATHPTAAAAGEVLP